MFSVSLNPARQTPPHTLQVLFVQWIKHFNFIQSKTPFVCMAVSCSICPRMSALPTPKKITSRHHSTTFRYLI